MKFLINLLLGITFGFGLILSGISNPKTVSLFSPESQNWNTSLLFTVCTIIVISIIFQIVTKKVNFYNNNEFFPKQSNTLTRHYILGAMFFGVGWGLSGLCASTATINLVFNDWESFLFFGFMVLGFYGPKFFKKITL